MFRPDLDATALGERLRDHSRDRISNILMPEHAAALGSELEAVSDWDVALTTAAGPVMISDQEWRSMSPPMRARHQEMLRRQARMGFSFAYFRRDVLPVQSGVGVGEAFAIFIQSTTFLETMQALTGDPDLVRADAHASLYRPGSFLKRHDDTYRGKERRYAYVLNLTREWQADWGGLLVFEDDEGNVIESFTPAFNSLSIFRVPQHHHVSQVATYALRPRLAITGWLFAE